MQKVIQSITISPTRSIYCTDKGLWQFLYQFNDGTSGHANHKAMQSPKKVGEVVDVEVTGAYNGVDNIKFAFNQQAAPQQQAAPAPQQAAPAIGHTGPPVMGVVVGACSKEALDLTLGGLCPVKEGTSVLNHLRTLTWYLIRDHAALENGWTPKEQRPQPVAAPAPPPPPPQNFPEPAATGNAAEFANRHEDEVFDEENVPF